MKPKSEKFEGKISFELNKHGLADVKAVEMIELVKYQEKKPKKKSEKKKEEKKKEEKDDQKMEIEEEEFEMVDKTKEVITPLKYDL